MISGMRRSAAWRWRGEGVASNGDERKSIWYVLRELYRGERHWIRNTQGSDEVRLAAEKRFSPLGEPDLERHLRYGAARGDFGQQALYLKPPRLECSAAAAIWCRWDFGNQMAACWFYLGLWLAERGFVGFRFEMPQEDNNHNYFHSQPCQTIGSREDPIPEALPVPERNPTWPLAASSSLELLLCLVVSVHGMNGLRELKTIMMNDPAMRQDRLLRDAFESVLGIRV